MMGVFVSATGIMALLRNAVLVFLVNRLGKYRKFWRQYKDGGVPSSQ
jgi:hypothetical protein